MCNDFLCLFMLKFSHPLTKRGNFGGERYSIINSNLRFVNDRVVLCKFQLKPKLRDSLRDGTVLMSLELMLLLLFLSDGN